MATSTQQLTNNLKVTAPAISPVFTVVGPVTDIQASATIVCPTNTNAQMQLNVERSTDGGATWFAISTTFAIGGTQQRGANIGQPLQVTVTVDVITPGIGDQFRANAVSASGGSFTISSSLTITS